MKNILILIMFSLFLTACATTNADDQKIKTTSELSGLFSEKIAASMADEDYDKIIHLLNTATPQETKNWINKNTRNKYEFTSLNVTVDADGQPCRTYQLRARRQLMQAEACRESDGTWRVKNGIELLKD